MGWFLENKIAYIVESMEVERGFVRVAVGNGSRDGKD